MLCGIAGKSRSREPKAAADPTGGAAGAGALLTGGGRPSVPMPTIVGARLGGPFGGAAGPAPAPSEAPVTDAVAPLVVTTNEWPHLGQRIFNPVAGTRRSSTWYGA